MAKKNSLALFGALLSIALLYCGCKKFEKEGHMSKPGIVLTFDDDRVDNWFTYLPLFDSTGVKATFYICRYNRFTADQKKKLAVIKSHGHEIAFHTTNHYDMQDYVYKQKHTIEELMICEIEGGLKLMNRDGFFPVTFAYPYGSHNGVIDKALMRYFKSVRALNGTQDFSKSVVTSENNDVLYGLGIDKSSKRTDLDVINIVKSAQTNNGCVVLVAHDINTSSKFSITIERLMSIISFVKDNQMKYYTACEISD